MSAQLTGLSEARGLASRNHRALDGSLLGGSVTGAAVSFDWVDASGSVTGGVALDAVIEACAARLAFSLTCAGASRVEESLALRHLQTALDWLDRRSVSESAAAAPLRP